MSKEKIGVVKPPLSLIERDHFYSRDGNLFCFKPDCENCSREPTCDRELISTKIGPGVNIRQSFCARDGYSLAAIDYKQIEIRVAAQLSGDPVWVEAFEKGLDLHSQMARVGWKIPESTPDSEIPKAVRDSAKCCNFGNLFLGSPQTLCQQSTLSLPEAVAAHKIWWDVHPVYKNWVEEQKLFYQKNTYVVTFFGRRRKMEAMIKKAVEEQPKYNGKGLWGFCDRTSVNSPIQGCLRPEVKVLTDKGYLTIGDLWQLQQDPDARKNFPKVWTGNNFADFQVLNRGKARYTNLHLKRRGYLPCDDRHKVKILTPQGWEWRSVTELQVGDQVAIARPIRIENSTVPDLRNFHGTSNNSKAITLDFADLQWAYLMGYFAGDGCFGKKESGYWIDFVSEDSSRGREHEAQVNTVLQKVGLEVTPHWVRSDPDKARRKWSITSKALGLALKEYGFVPNCGAPNKEIPKRVFALSTEARIAFLKGLFDSDGTKLQGNWGWHNSSFNLVKGLYLLLRTLGVDSKYSETGDGNWKIDIISKETFATLVGLTKQFTRRNDGGNSVPEAFRKRAISLLEEMKSDLGPTERTILSRLRGGGTTNITTLERILGHPIEEFHYYSEVEAVDILEESGDTFTLSVEDEFHQFDSEGVISKNTAADLMKMGMVNVANWIEKKGYQNDIRQCLTVHDEMVLEIKNSPSMYELLRDIAALMIFTPRDKKYPTFKGWKIPLGTDIEIGPNWANMKDIDALDPSTKDKPKAQEKVKSSCILVLPSLNQNVLNYLYRSIAEASYSDDALKLPLKIQMGGKLYNSSNPGMQKVNPLLLEKKVRDLQVNGIMVKYD